jgi:hypothetical protein
MTSTAGNLKNVIMTIVGAFAFGDFRFSVWNSVGLGMSMVGAIWYAAKSAMKVSQHKRCDSSSIMHAFCHKLETVSVSGHDWGFHQ